MADIKKISELTALISPDDADLLAIVDTSETTTKKITGANLKTYAQGTLPERMTTIEANGIIGTTQYGGTIASDLNVITKDGFYTCYGGATGAPNTLYSWFVTHQNSNSGTVSATQIAIAYVAGEPIVYMRNKISSAWGSWVLMPSRSEIANLNLGWTNAGETWTYVNSTTFTVLGDVTTKYQKGDKLKWAQNSTIRYNHVIATPVYNAGTGLTTIAVHNGYITSAGDCSVLATASYPITANYYSKADKPQGFPDYFNWTPTTSGVTKGAGGTLTTRFSINGNILSFYIFFAYGTGSSISGRNTFTMPVANLNSGYGQTYILAGSAYMGLCEISPGQIAVDGALASGTYVAYSPFSATVPVTWSSGNTYSATGWYFI